MLENQIFLQDPKDYSKLLYCFPFFSPTSFSIIRKSLHVFAQSIASLVEKRFQHFSAVFSEIHLALSSISLFFPQFVYIDFRINASKPQSYTDILTFCTKLGKSEIHPTICQFCSFSFLVICLSSLFQSLLIDTC